jgi:formate dehydrogenase accessory protein FdhD
LKSGKDLLLNRLGYSEPSAQRPMWRLSDGEGDMGLATVAEEVPIALAYNGRPFVVVMGTPADLEDLAVGFSLTEGIVDNEGAIERIGVVKASHGIELQIEIGPADAARLEERSRNMVSRTGCGLCGVETINDAIRLPARLDFTLDIARDALWRASEQLSSQQTLNNETSTVHAAAWATKDGEIEIVREDVGRHNALDKVLGAMARDHRVPNTGFVLVTSRASYEMVQKVAVCGVEIVAAISRPTGLAMRMAQAAGVTLVGLLRGRTANVYACPQRIT